MDKSWVKTEPRVGYWRHKTDLRLGNHSSTLSLQEHLAKTCFLVEAQGIEYFNKWQYQTPKLLVNQLELDWENIHKETHFLDLQRERQMTPSRPLVVPLPPLISPSLTWGIFRRWRFLSAFFTKAHNCLLQHLVFQQSGDWKKKEVLVLAQKEDVKHLPYISYYYAERKQTPPN